MIAKEKKEDLTSEKNPFQGLDEKEIQRKFGYLVPMSQSIVDRIAAYQRVEVERNRHALDSANMQQVH